MRLLFVVLTASFLGLSYQATTPEITTMNHEDHTHNHEDVTHNHEDHTHNHEDVTHDHDGDHDMDGGMGHSMPMYFHVSSHATILFEGWHTMVYWELFLSCLAIMVMAILYEGFKEFRQSLLRKNVKVAARTTQKTEASYKSTEALQMSSTTEKIAAHDLESDPSTRSSSSLTSNTSMTSQLMDSSHLLQAGLHVLHLFFSYCLMLVFMTYNAYLCIALCLGGGIGYWLFAWKRADVIDPNDHCN